MTIAIVIIYKIIATCYLHTYLLFVCQWMHCQWLMTKSYHRVQTALTMLMLQIVADRLIRMRLPNLDRSLFNLVCVCVFQLLYFVDSRSYVPELSVAWPKSSIFVEFSTNPGEITKIHFDGEMCNCSECEKNDDPTSVNGIQKPKIKNEASGKIWNSGDHTENKRGREKKNESKL